LPAVLVAVAVCWSNTDGIARCGMSMATLEATGRRHQATTCSVLPQQPPGQQANKQQSTNDSKMVAILMAMAMRRYITAHFTQWRRLRAFLDATKRHHQASIAANNGNWSCMCRFFQCFHCQNRRKSLQVDAKAPVFNGVLHIK
jgi:hypothetical protein